MTYIGGNDYSTPCELKQAQACKVFENINSDIIELVVKYYNDLQTYANFTAAVDNDPLPLTTENSIYGLVQKLHNGTYMKDGNPLAKIGKNPLLHSLFDNNMTILVNQMKDKIKEIRMSSNDYLQGITELNFFSSGDVSPTVIYQAIRSEEEKEVEMIVKIAPLEMPHHLVHFPVDQRNMYNNFVISPQFSIFIKEAWMYCFVKNYLSSPPEGETRKYLDTFTCIRGAFIVKGFPDVSLNDVAARFEGFKQKKIEKANRENKAPKIPYKKWFDQMVNEKDSNAKTYDYFNLPEYGVFEMERIDGTLNDLIYERKQMTLGILFEYLYSKMVCAFLGRIIFTDDHSDNVAFKQDKNNQATTRHYQIKSKGCLFNFYVTSQYQLKFIDLERYIFNPTPYDIYSNVMVKNYNENDKIKNVIEMLSQTSDDINADTITGHYEMIDELKSNNYLFDKGTELLLMGLKNNPNKPKSSHINPEHFSAYPEEHPIAIELLSDPFVFDIHQFAQTMQNYLPSRYLQPPFQGQKIESYYINLDDNSQKIFRFDDILKAI
jgi:hypothetical protein